MMEVIILCSLYMFFLIFIKQKYFKKSFIYACLIGTIIGQIIYITILNF